MNSNHLTASAFALHASRCISQARESGHHGFAQGIADVYAWIERPGSLRASAKPCTRTDAAARRAAVKASFSASPFEVEGGV